MQTVRTFLHCTLIVSFMFLICACVPTRTEAPPAQVTATPELSVEIPGVTQPALAFPCSMGIWDTLEFGVTTEEQLNQWLTESTFVHRPSLSDSWVEESIGAPKRHRYIWDVKDRGIYRTSMRIYVMSGTLSSLWTPFFYPITLGEVVAKLGSPESVSVHLDNRYDERAYFYEVYYPTQGIVISGAIYDQTVCDQIAQKAKGLLEPTWLVTNLTCNAPGTLSEVIGAMYGISPQAAESMVALTQPWQDFGAGYSLDP